MTQLRQLIQANPVGHHRPLEARQARHALRPGLLPAGHAADLPAEPGQADPGSLSGVSAVSTGPVLKRRPPDGTVPKIIAKIKAGGPAAVDHGPRAVPADSRPSRTRFAPASRSCRPRAAAAPGAATRPTRTSLEAPARTNGGGGRGGFGGGGPAGGGGFNRGAFAKCLPPEFRNFRRTITTPQQTIQQIVDPPQTNIKSSSYTIAGVDPTQPAIGLVTPSLVASGRFIAPEGNPRGAPCRLLREPQNKLKVGSTLDLNNTNFKVVGLVQPPLGGQTADVYMPLTQLQRLAGEKGLANVVLVRARAAPRSGRAAGDPAGAGRRAGGEREGRRRQDQGLARRTHRTSRAGSGSCSTILAAVAAFLIAVLLTLTSVGKRVRELGTLEGARLDAVARSCGRLSASRSTRWRRWRRARRWTRDPRGCCGRRVRGRH